MQGSESVHLLHIPQPSSRRIFKSVGPYSLNFSLPCWLVPLTSSEIGERFVLLEKCTESTVINDTTLNISRVLSALRYVRTSIISWLLATNSCMFHRP